jgi:hypothetical protein
MSVSSAAILYRDWLQKRKRKSYVRTLLRIEREVLQRLSERDVSSQRERRRLLRMEMSLVLAPVHVHTRAARTPTSTEALMYRYRPLRPPLKPRKEKMNLTKINLRHTADDAMLEVKEIYVTENRSLMVVGKCQKCHGQVCVNISFLELYEAVPDTNEQVMEADRILLHSLGVKLPEEEATQ